MTIAAGTPKMLSRDGNSCLAYRPPNTMYHPTASAS